MANTIAENLLRAYITIPYIDCFTPNGDKPSLRIQNLSRIFPGIIHVNGCGYKVVVSGEITAYLDALAVKDVDPTIFDSYLILNGAVAYSPDKYANEITLEPKPSYSVLLQQCDPFLYTGDYIDPLILDDLSD